jgi:hypothetical protein
MSLLTSYRETTGGTTDTRLTILRLLRVCVVVFIEPLPNNGRRDTLNRAAALHIQTQGLIGSFFFRFPNVFAICIHTFKCNQQIVC